MSYKITLPTGEEIDSDDIDTLIATYRTVDKVYQKCRDSRSLIARVLGGRTPDSDTRTRRVEGTRLRAVMEMPEAGYDNSQLIRIWNSTPDSVRKRVLKITGIGIQKREFKKLCNSDLPPALELLVRQIQAAETGPAGQPRVKKVEEVDAQGEQEGQEVGPDCRSGDAAQSEAG